jgi:predicted transcriptional regulator
VPALNRRSRAQVIYAILKVTSESERTGARARKTTIMYRANLNFFRLNRYFRELEKHGILKESINPRHVYCLTEKGRELLRLIDAAQEIIEL